MQKSRFSVIFHKIKIKIEQFDRRSSRLMSTVKVSSTVATDAYKRQLQDHFWFHHASFQSTFSRRVNIILDLPMTCQQSNILSIRAINRNLDYVQHCNRSRHRQHHNSRCISHHLTSDHSDFSIHVYDSLSAACTSRSSTKSDKQIFSQPNVYRIIANVVSDASVVALMPALQSQSALVTAEVQTAAEVAVVEMQMTQSSPHIRLNYSGFFSARACVLLSAAYTQSYKQFFIA